MVSEKTNGEDRDCFSIASADCYLKVRLNIYVEDLPLLAELRNIVQPDTELTVFDIPSRSTSGSSDDDPEITASSTERFGLRWKCQVRSGSGRTCHRKTLEKAQPRTELGRCRDTTLRLRRRQTGAALPAKFRVRERPSIWPGEHWRIHLSRRVESTDANTKPQKNSLVDMRGVSRSCYAVCDLS